MGSACSNHKWACWVSLESPSSPECFFAKSFGKVFQLGICYKQETVYTFGKRKIEKPKTRKNVGAFLIRTSTCSCGHPTVTHQSPPIIASWSLSVRFASGDNSPPEMSSPPFGVDGCISEFLYERTFIFSFLSLSVDCRVVWGSVQVGPDHFWPVCGDKTTGRSSPFQQEKEREKAALETFLPHSSSRMDIILPDVFRESQADGKRKRKRKGKGNRTKGKTNKHLSIHVPNVLVSQPIFYSL
mmetsp:Transcript_29903/g.77191  ORF Transcript_29903/g.77191 Transcript_29903/m.77191 type:complete len:242 (+) Transcript_29903:1369-2094(+)